MGHSYLYWYNQTGEEKYKSAADIVRNQLNGHPRTLTGGFWHREPTYPNQMWLDGIFMADSFYAKWTNWFDAGNVCTSVTTSQLASEVPQRMIRTTFNPHWFQS
jgi:rhamnogalacturonyl hydrolase YesR